jgi:hypothetical protein
MFVTFCDIIFKYLEGHVVLIYYGNIVNDILTNVALPTRSTTDNEGGATRRNGVEPKNYRFGSWWVFSYGLWLVSDAVFIFD